MTEFLVTTNECEMMKLKEVECEMEEREKIEERREIEGNEMIRFGNICSLHSLSALSRSFPSISFLHSVFHPTSHP